MNLSKKRLMYNWPKITNLACNDIYSILILVVCSYVGYNNFIASDKSSLCKYLNIKYIPNSLFIKKFIKTYGKDTKIYSNIAIENPQSYVIDISFLQYNHISNHDKVVYLDIASKRSISDNSNQIDKILIPKSYLTNPLIEETHNTIILKH